MTSYDSHTVSQDQLPTRLTIIDHTHIDVASSDALVPDRHHTDVMANITPIKLEEESKRHPKTNLSWQR